MSNERIYRIAVVTVLVAVVVLVWGLDKWTEPSPLEGAPDYFVEALEAYDGWDKACDRPEDGLRMEVVSGVWLLREDALRCAFKWQMAGRNWEDLDEANQTEIAPLIAGLYIMTRDPEWKRYDMCELEYSSRGTAFTDPVDDKSFPESVQKEFWLDQIGAPCRRAGMMSGQVSASVHATLIWPAAWRALRIRGTHVVGAGQRFVEGQLGLVLYCGVVFAVHFLCGRSLFLVLQYHVPGRVFVH